MLLYELQKRAFTFLIIEFKNMTVINRDNVILNLLIFKK
jgi:hypothetical protein